MNLLTNLMTWAQSQSGRMVFSPKNFELSELINDTVELLSGVSKQKSILIENAVSVNSQVFADKEMVGTVLRNLISNAVKFTHPGGKVKITAKHGKKELVVAISDNGVGISRKRIKNIFNIAESNRTAGTQKEKGTGLGLILCKEFVNKNSGKIWVQSEEGKGSTFFFSIPLAVNADTEPDMKNVPSP